MSDETQSSPMDTPSTYTPSNIPPVKVRSTPSAQEPDHSTEPGPEPYISHYDGKSWELRIFQQPIRARMCGFGDKDRRPISPPPCIRLIVRDLATGKEIDSKNLNLGVLILQVDLYDKDGITASNGVYSTTNSPSISSVMPTEFPPAYTGYNQPNPGYRVGGYQNVQRPSYGASYNTTTAYTSPVATTPTGVPPYTNFPSHHQQQHRFSNDSSNYTSQYPRSDGYSRDARSSMSSVSTNGHSMPPQSPYQQGGGPGPFNYARPPTNYNEAPHDYPLNSRSTPSSVSKNLIGSSVVNAHNLKDTENQSGIWFVTQDLSVRTEGWFRLKFSFFDLGAPGRKEMYRKTPPKDSPVNDKNKITTTNGEESAPPPARQQQQGHQLPSLQRAINGSPPDLENPSQSNGNKSALPADEASTQIAELGVNVPCLAHVFSAPFQVWSAKKFPGVIESTALSKKFAGQGVKIPIRKESKDGPGGAGGKRKRKAKKGEESTDEEDEDEEGDDGGKRNTGNGGGDDGDEDADGEEDGAEDEEGVSKVPDAEVGQVCSILSPGISGEKID